MVWTKVIEIGGVMLVSASATAANASTIIHVNNSLVLLSSFFAPDSFSARCIGVSDGDTIVVLRDRSSIKVRLEGIDCPERGQDFGHKAKQFTSRLVFGKTVKIDAIGQDRYGRIVARVVVDGKDVSVELLKLGLA